MNDNFHSLKTPYAFHRRAIAIACWMSLLLACGPAAIDQVEQPVCDTPSTNPNCPPPRPASCDQTNGGCDPNATCVLHEEGVACSCLPGWVGDGLNCGPGPTPGSRYHGVAMLKAPTPTADAAFGQAMAISRDGTTMAIGTPNATAEAAGGTVYLYRLIGGSWVFETTLAGPGDTLSTTFAGALALDADGTTLAVGAMNEDALAAGVNTVPSGTLSNSGAAYVYERINGQWQLVAYLKASNSAADANFGYTLALDDAGSTLAVTALWERGTEAGPAAVPGELGNQESGAVYIFHKSPDWIQTAYLKALNPSAMAMFGKSLAFAANGKRLVISEAREDGGVGGFNAPSNTDMPESGRVYIAEFANDAWTYPVTVKAPVPSSYAEFGSDVAISADGAAIAVGARGEASEVGNGAGAVYMYRFHLQTWALDAHLRSPNPDGHDMFGRAIALSSDGGLLTVAADGEDGSAAGVGGAFDNALPVSGAGYAFARSADGWLHTDYLKAGNPEAYDFLGYNLAMSGDGSVLAVSSVYEATSAGGMGPTPNDASPGSGAVYLFK